MILRSPLAVIAAALLLAGSPSAQTTLETFETFAGLGPYGVTLGVAALDEHTIANGQGPGLVLDGCTYSCAGELQWNGAGYYGSTSQNILSNTDGQLDLVYDSPVTSMSVDLMAYDGYGDVVVVTVYNAALLPIYTSPPIAIPDSTPVPFAYSAVSIGRVSLQSAVWDWSALIDDHEFGLGGPALMVSGSCPGPTTANVTGATPHGNVALAIALNAGSFTIPGGPCGGAVLGLQQPALVGVFTASGAGVVTLSGNLPPGFCGRRLQAVDLASCAPTNVVQL